MKKLYFYPISARNDKIVSFNPYTFDFVDALENHYIVVNKNKPSAKGILNLIRYFFNINFIVLNWIEDLPEKKGGFLQTMFLLMIMSLSKILRVKIIWVMHNKLSHSKKHEWLKKIIFRRLIKKSDYIITHSSEGIEYVGGIDRNSKDRIHYWPHPVKDRRKPTQDEFKIDILIWGTLAPYKGILEFLQLIHESDLEHKYRIFIIGKSSSAEYLKSLSKFTNENIIIKDDFVDDNTLQDLCSKSKIVLFTYAKSSILSSGALMDSIGFGARVIGPEVGAFSDLNKEGIIKTYADSTELFTIIDEELSKPATHDAERINEFLKANSWRKFAENLHEVLSQK